MASNHLVGPFLGINNRLPDNQLSYTERGVKLGNFVRNAVNVDFTERGSVQRRQGVAQVQAGGECHSLWSSGDDGFYVDNGTLYRFPRTALATGLPNRRVSFTVAGDKIVWTDGVTINQIIGNDNLPLTQPEPNPLPIVTTEATGSLVRGSYLVSFVAVGASGQSAPTWPLQIDVPANGRILITGITGAVRIFLSGPNGQELFFYATAVGAVDIPLPAEGAMLTTLHYRPMPPGDIVRYHKGRLLVASGNTLFYSQPYATGLYDPTRGYIPFPEPITMVAPVQSGVFVSTDKTYFLAGDDIEKSEVIERLPFAAVFGTDTRSEHDESVWWYSEHGTVQGTPEGEVEVVNFRNVVPTQAQSGASLYREQDGMRQIISSLTSGDFSRAAASSFIDAEVIRKERTQ